MDKDKKEDDNKKAGSSHEPQSEKRRDRDSISSNSYSSLDLELKEEPKILAHSGKRSMRLPKKRKYRRATGRVQKRKPKKTKRKPRPRYTPKIRSPSDTSISSKNTLSIRRAAVTCNYCGHRCCLRRYMEKKRRFGRKLKTSRAKKQSHRLNKKTVSEMCQMGTPSLMFSKLFVGCGPNIGNPGYADHYEEISPQMIYQCLHDLSMWRHAIPLDFIFEYIMKNYPINPNTNEAMDELMDKLRVAQIAGIAWAMPNNCWRLTTALERVHRLELNHVTLFWKAYWDTMKPLDRNRQKNVVQNDKIATTEGEEGTDRYDII